MRTLDLKEKPGLADDVELDNLLRSVAEDPSFEKSVQEVAAQLRVQPTESLLSGLMELLESISDVPPPDDTDDMDTKIAALKLSIRTSLDRQGEARLPREVEVERDADEEVEVEVDGEGVEREVEYERMVREEEEEDRTEHEPEVVSQPREVEVEREVEEEIEEVRTEHEPEVISQPREVEVEREEEEEIPEVRTEVEPEKRPVDRDADRLAAGLRDAKMAFFDTAKFLGASKLGPAVEVLLQNPAYEDALQTIDDNAARFAELFGMADLSVSVETELLRIQPLKDAITNEVSEYLVQQVKDANKAAVDGTSNKASVPIRVAGKLMLIGENHVRRALLYCLLRTDGEAGTVTVAKSTFSSGKLTVSGISDDDHQRVVTTSVARFSKATVAFE